MTPERPLGVERPSGRRRKYLTVAAVLVPGTVALILFAAMAGTDPADNLVLVETAAAVDSSGRYVTGTLRNNTNDTYSAVQLEIVFLDRERQVTERATVRTTDLGPHATWSFRASVAAPEAVRFRLQNLTCIPSLDSPAWEARRACAIAPGVSLPPYTGDLTPARD